MIHTQVKYTAHHTHLIGKTCLCRSRKIYNSRTWYVDQSVSVHTHTWNIYFFNQSIKSRLENVCFCWPACATICFLRARLQRLRCFSLASPSRSVIWHRWNTIDGPEHFTGKGLYNPWSLGRGAPITLRGYDIQQIARGPSRSSRRTARWKKDKRAEGAEVKRAGRGEIHTTAGSNSSGLTMLLFPPSLGTWGWSQHKKNEKRMSPRQEDSQRDRRVELLPVPDPLPKLDMSSISMIVLAEVLSAVAGSKWWSLIISKFCHNH